MKTRIVVAIVVAAAVAGLMHAAHSLDWFGIVRRMHGQ